jgi:hypothetical protein
LSSLNSPESSIFSDELPTLTSYVPLPLAIASLSGHKNKTHDHQEAHELVGFRPVSQLLRIACHPDSDRATSEIQRITVVQEHVEALSQLTVFHFGIGY